MTKTVFLSAGHSELDPGAIAHGRREADVAVEFRNMVSFYLLRAGTAHDLDGTGTRNMPLNEAAKIAEEHDISIEFHCNAGPEAASGTEALSAPGNAELAADISEAVSVALSIKDRGAKPESAGRHTRLAFVRAGGIIVELFFITNELDLMAYGKRKWLAAKAVADVLIRESAQTVARPVAG